MDLSDKEKLKSVIKTEDSWWTMLLPAKAANRIVGLLADTNVTPNQVTLASLFLGIFAALLFCSSMWFYEALGAIVLQASFILDCADGQLARLKNKCTKRGAWLDLAADVGKVFAVYFGITFGAVAKYTDPSLWAWGFYAYFLSVSGMFLFFARSNYLSSQEELSDDDRKDQKRLMEKIYHTIRDNAYFLSFSLPDQFLLISIFALLGVVGLLLKTLALWGTAAMLFSIGRTWIRLKTE